MRLGVPRHHHRLTDSTNSRARELAEAGTPGGTLVTADEQSAGRGRQGRRWSAPPGKALLASLVMRPLEKRHALLPLAVPLAVSEAIESLAPVACRLKWPNDVWIEERKVCGILIEASPSQGWAVVGIGINVGIEGHEFPEELRDTATSVGHGATVEALLAAVLERLESWTEAPERELLAAFRERDALRGRRISWAGGAGTAAGVDEAGGLLVESAAGRLVSLTAGEVHLTVEQ